jgi:dGTPase
LPSQGNGRPSYLTDRFKIGFGHQPRFTWACEPAQTRGRLFAEQPSPTRTEFQRDRDRIVHSTAFRRLKHKTQVFVENEGDHYRTRLTHTLEVAQIARGLARAFRLDEDLTEAIALAHDFGHTPFGHAGERALNSAMADFGGFDHNAQSVRIVTELEHTYARFDGLNLTYETLEGLVKHNGPLIDGSTKSIPADILSLETKMPLGLDQWPSLEAQCAAIADDIAYNSHDIDDGLRSGLLNLSMIAEAPLAGDILAEVQSEFAGLEAGRTIHEVTRRQITMMVEDVLQHSLSVLEELDIKSSDDARLAGQKIIGFSGQFVSRVSGLTNFMYNNLYWHQTVLDKMASGQAIIADLFTAYLKQPALLGVSGAINQNTPVERQIADYIAGMTDRFAIKEHRRLFDHTPDMG